MENALAVYSPHIVDTSLTDWMVTPSQKLHNVLANMDTVRKKAKILSKTDMDGA